MKKYCVLALLLCASAYADDWKDKLSPRMREAFKDLAREDWKPQKAATLSEKEKTEFRNLWEVLQKTPILQMVPAKPMLRGLDTDQLIEAEI